MTPEVEARGRPESQRLRKGVKQRQRSINSNQVILRQQEYLINPSKQQKEPIQISNIPLLPISNSLFLMSKLWKTQDLHSKQGGKIRQKKLRATEKLPCSTGSPGWSPGMTWKDGMRGGDGM